MTSKRCAAFLLAQPVVAALFQEPAAYSKPMTEAEFEWLADAFAEFVLLEQTPLSDEAVSRAGSYAEHP